MTSPTPLSVQSTPSVQLSVTPSPPITVISTLPNVPTQIPASITSTLTTVSGTSTSTSVSSGSVTSTGSVTTAQPSNVVVVVSEAVLPLKGTTVTAYEVAGQTGEAILGAQTIQFRGPGVDVGNGQTVSLGANDIEDKTATASFSALATPLTITLSSGLPGPYSVHSTGSGSGSTSSLKPTITLPGPLSSLTTGTASVTSGLATSFTTQPGVPTNVTPGPVGTTTASPTPAPLNAAGSLSVGKAVALLAGLAGLAAYAL